MEKTSFEGDIGQVVMGNATEGHHLSNVVNIDMGKNADVKALTSHQKRAIRKKILEWESLTGRSRMGLHGELLNEYGAERMATFPGDRYRDAQEFLDRKLEALKSEKKETRNDENPACPGCVQLVHQLDTLKKVTIGLTVCVLIISCCVGWKSTFHPEFGLKPNPCYLDGKIYSIGSIAKMADGTLHICEVLTDSMSAIWVETVNKRRR